jgi:hypothetical protein
MTPSEIMKGGQTTPPHEISPKKVIVQLNESPTKLVASEES